jgi:hypothetical protein
MVGWKLSTLVALAMLDQFVSTALLLPLQFQKAHALRNFDLHFRSQRRNASSSPDTTRDTEKNSVFVEGLKANLSKLCDKYIISGSPKIREQVFNVLEQIASEAIDREQVNQSIRMVKRAGVPM